MPYAIIRTAGFQYRVEPGKTIRIPTREADVGSSITFDEVLLGSDGTNVHAGAPLVPGATVTAQVVRHGRGRKIIVFKMKRRKNYARKQGHRQGFTEVKINDINLG
ncbi:MAG TPA: 50S ribosomal protein L21 [Gemmatimonadaceae bacterium]|nr:50S ribosomal protein L21 [Gemmatimonadaceae bacterium]